MGTKIGMKRTTPKHGIRKHLPTKWELDKLFSDKIRAKGCCEYCGKVLPKEKLECHHFIPRVFLQTRYEPDAACSVDSSCHFLLQNHARENEAFFIKLRGQERVEELYRTKIIYKKFDRERTLDYMRSRKSL